MSNLDSAMHLWANIVKMSSECRSVLFQSLCFFQQNEENLLWKDYSLYSSKVPSRIGFLFLLRKIFVNEPRMIQLHLNIMDQGLNISLYKIALATQPRHLAIYFTSFGISYQFFLAGGKLLVLIVLDQITRCT